MVEENLGVKTYYYTQAVIDRPYENLAVAYGR